MQPSLIPVLRKFGTKACQLIAIVLMAASLALPASAASVTDLVAERSELEFGLEMPANGRFDVSLAVGLLNDGQLITDFWIDRKTGQFIANVVTNKGDVRRVWGLSMLTIPVPVPTRRILPDDIISPQDIAFVDIPWARVSALTATNVSEVEGMQVRRVLSPGRPIQRQSVIPPVVISRGQRVTIKLTAGSLQLTAAGKAIGDAHIGQEVRVVNLGSNKIIVGVARGDGLVEAVH